MMNSIVRFSSSGVMLSDGLRQKAGDEIPQRYAWRKRLLLQSGGPIENDIYRRVRYRSHQTGIGPGNEDTLTIRRNSKCIPSARMAETRIGISGIEQHSRLGK